MILWALLLIRDVVAVAMLAVPAAAARAADMLWGFDELRSLRVTGLLLAVVAAAETLLLQLLLWCVGLPALMLLLRTAGRMVRRGDDAEDEGWVPRQQPW